MAEGPVREVKVVLSDKNETFFFSIFVVSQNLDFCVGTTYTHLIFFFLKKTHLCVCACDVCHRAVSRLEGNVFVFFLLLHGN